MLHAYHRHRVRRASDAPGVHGPRSAPEAPEGFDGPETLDRCDAYVVLVVDPETGAVDSYGPLSATTPCGSAAERPVPVTNSRTTSSVRVVALPEKRKDLTAPACSP